jgi:hypothetical protein
MTIDEMIKQIDNECSYPEALQIIRALRAGQDLWRYGRAQKGYEAAWNASQEAFEAATKGE